MSNVTETTKINVREKEKTMAGHLHRFRASDGSDTKKLRKEFHAYK